MAGTWYMLTHEVTSHWPTVYLQPMYVNVNTVARTHSASWFNKTNVPSSLARSSVILPQGLVLYLVSHQEFLVRWGFDRSPVWRKQHPRDPFCPRTVTTLLSSLPWHLVIFHIFHATWCSWDSPMLFWVIVVLLFLSLWSSSLCKCITGCFYPLRVLGGLFFTIGVIVKC